ncbi:IS3 family transposase [Pseudomonas berkeleyensis]
MNGIYGHRRIKAELAGMGHACGRHLVARLTREACLRVRSRKRWRLVSSSRHALPIASNHLNRQFASDRANRYWVSDMTYVRAAQGWLYLAAVTSCCRLGDAPSDAAGPGTRRIRDSRCSPTAANRGTAALGS